MKALTDKSFGKKLIAFLAITALFFIRLVFMVNSVRTNLYYLPLLVVAIMAALVMLYCANICKKSSVFFVMLLIADPLLSAGVEGVCFVIATVIALLCILLIIHKTLSKAIYFIAAVASVLITYLVPGMLFSFVPAIVAVYLAKNGKKAANAPALMAVSACFGVLGASVATLGLKNYTATEFATRIGRFEVKPLVHVINENYKINILPDFSTSLLIFIPVIVVTVYFAAKLLNIIIKQHRKDYIFHFALLVVPPLISIIGKLIFGNGSDITMALNFTPLIVLLMLNNYNDEVLNPIFNEFKELIDKYSPITLISVIYLASCSFAASGPNWLFGTITHYLV